MHCHTDPTIYPIIYKKNRENKRKHLSVKKLALKRRINIFIHHIQYLALHLQHINCVKCKVQLSLFNILIQVST